MRKTWALVMAAAMAAASLTACSSSKPAETAAPETEAEAAETEETEAEAEATGDQQEILVAAAASLQDDIRICLHIVIDLFDHIMTCGTERHQRLTQFLCLCQCTNG